jgi:hypothetical protein
MKRVEEMTIEEMEGYFGKVDRIVAFIGRSYRLFWPFDVFSPFSPTRFLLNCGVLATWGIAIMALLDRPPIEETALQLGQIWVSIGFLVLIIGFFERHIRIKIRYRRLMRQHQFGRVARVFSPSGKSDTIPEARKVDVHEMKHDHSHGDTATNTQTDTSPDKVRTVTGEIIAPEEDQDLVGIGIDILRKLFRK